MVTFVELPLFTDQITRLADDSDYVQFQKDLLRQPEQGDVIPGSGGLRKTRMRLPGRGKRGGARVIYLHLPKQDTIVLFYLTPRRSAKTSVPTNFGGCGMRLASLRGNFEHEKAD